MRLYMNGTTSRVIPKDDAFILSQLHFSNDNCDDDTIYSDDCMILEGLECETSHEGNEFSCRWKGITLQQDEEETLTVKDVIDTIVDKNMKVTNLSGYVDGDVDVVITDIVLVDELFRVELQQPLFRQMIRFEGDD